MKNPDTEGVGIIEFRVECLEFRDGLLDQDLLAVDDVEACRGGLVVETTAVEGVVGGEFSVER